jgi:RHS repeat-associated protein
VFGYRYDTETGLYYLQSRYYNADWGRFINADSLLGETGDLLSHNMFAYCKNNPVNMDDPDGDIAWWIVGGVAGGIAGGIYSYAKTGRVDWRYVAGGALVGAGLGYLAQPTIVYAATKAVELSRAQNRNLETLDNIVNGHLTDMDFLGTLRDLRGNPVPKPSGGYWNHLQEMKDSYGGLIKIKRGIEGSLNNPNLSRGARQALQSGLDKANANINKIEKLFKPFGGIK